MILAGGLTPANVREAIERLDPDVVDVSSGVEISPGVKDHGMMKAFVEAATAAKKGTE
jgi:phosphoribosylanthranilate isomerase